MRVLVLGAGKMTEAILTGWKSSVDMSSWGIYSPSGASAQSLATQVGAQVVSDPASFLDADWILVGCKPQQLKDLKAKIGDGYDGKLFVSMLAAVSESDQKEILGCRHLIRIMPNLPVKLHAGVVLMSSTSAQERLLEFFELFKTLGLAVIVKEPELEELTLLTGSGPAFFYRFALELASVATSLTDSQREVLSRQVLIGSGLQLLNDSKNLQDHIAAVTSKGGVTIAVLDFWNTSSLTSIFKAGFSRGLERMSEVRETLRRN